MHSCDVLISVTRRYADAFRAGEKTAEVRRRRLNVAANSRVWIYTKLPEGRVQLVGRIAATASGTPMCLWKAHGPQTALTRAEFFAYLDGCEAAYIILIDSLRELTNQLTLAELRRSEAGFQPPQFAKFLRDKDAIYRVLRSTDTVVLDRMLAAQKR